MRDWDRNDYLVALGIGALVGVGAALLLRPKRGRVQRIRRRLEPYGKQVRGGARRTRAAMVDGTEAARELGEELAESGRALIDGYAKELKRLGEAAREEVSVMIERQLREARDGVRRGAEKVGL